MRATSGNAERLQRSAGAWKLEFQQLVYNTPTLLRPRRFAVQGEQAILQQLRELSGHEPLAKDTERLFSRGSQPDGTYVVRDGRWFPELRPDSVADAPPSAEADAAPTARAGRGALDELTKRITSLEQSVQDMHEMLERAVKTLTAIASRAGGLPPSAAGGALDATMNASLSGAVSEHAIPAPAPAPAAAPGAAADASPPAAPERKVISLPGISALSDLVKGLAGPDAALASSERIDWNQVATNTPVFCSVIQDNGGDEAGSMLFDLEGALRLAGALLMESEEVVLSLLEEKVMSDEMLDAASEVCNTMMSSFNKVSGNPHLKVGKMQPLSAARAAELPRMRKRDDYRYTQGGRISMIAR